MDSFARRLYARGPLPDTHATQTPGSGPAPPHGSRAHGRLRSALAKLALAVGSLVCFFGLLELFAWRAQSDVPERLARLPGLRDAEVADLDGAFPRQQHVVRRHVAMDDAA